MCLKVECVQLADKAIAYVYSKFSRKLCNSRVSEFLDKHRQRLATEENTSGTILKRHYYHSMLISNQYLLLYIFLSNGMSCMDRGAYLTYCIRSTVRENIEFDDELPPSREALWRHRLRSCWVSHFWSQSSSNSYHTLPLNVNGWKVREGLLTGMMIRILSKLKRMCIFC